MLDSTTILHVDDDLSFGELTKSFLERENDRFAIETVTSANEALERITNRTPDCVVSDYNMPGMDGLEFLEAVRETHPELPFILFTGKGSEEVASDAIAAGVTDYIQKGSGTSHYTVLANRILNAVEAARSAAKAEKRRHRVEQILKTVPGCVVQTDADGQFVFANERAESVLGLKADEVTQRGYNDPEWELEEPNGEPIPEEELPFRQVRDTGEPIYDRKHAITWPDGSRKILTVNAAPLFDETGAVESVVASVSDITDRRERQQELRLLQRSVDNADVPITLADPSKEDDPLVYVNDGFERMTGYPPEETLGRNCRFLQGEDTDPEKVATLREAIDNGETVSVELCNYRKDGTEFWNRLTVAPIYDDDDDLVRYLGTQQDVTERKQRERELKTERRFVQQALDALDDIFYVIDTDGTLQRWNEEGLQVTGYSESELNDMPATELFPEDDREAVARSIETIITDGEGTLNADLLTAGGQRIPYEFKGARLTGEDGTVTGLVGIGRDITARRETEAAVDWHQTIIRNMQEGAYVLNADHELQFVSYRAKDPEGVSRSDWTGRQLSYLAEVDMLSPSEVEQVRDGVDRLVAGEADQLRIEVEPELPESTKNTELTLTPLEINTDTNHVLVTTRDITKYKQREQEILELKRQYQTLAENLPNGAVFLFDTDLRYVRARGAELEAVGIPPDTIEGATPHDVFPEETADELVRYFTDALDGNSHTFTQTLGDRTYRIRTVPVGTDEQEVTYGLALSQNVTNQIERRRELERQNERLDEFASIVSHDLRNPLNVAEGYLELAETTEENEHLAKVSDAIGRSQTLIDDLLELAREGDQVDETEPVSLPEIAESSWQTVETEQATVTADGSRVIEADRNRLQQLLENLYRNAVEHGGDEITVSVGEISDGFYVADSGPGIPRGEREKIFKPGYSTGAGGTGFGLRVAEQIAEAHGWEITVTESAQGGARFEFTGVERVD
jgi:PAS domain S-box-containing protein